MARRMMVRLVLSRAWANGPPMAHRSTGVGDDEGPGEPIMAVAWAFAVERVRRIELPLSAWELEEHRPSGASDLRVERPNE